MTIFVSEPGNRREIGWQPTGWAFIDLFASAVMNRRLLMSFVLRDIASRYKGATLGVLWIIGSPLAMVAAYGFVIAGVFGMRMGAADDVKSTVIGLWSCLAAWQLFAETANRGTGIILDNAALVKRTAFPLSLLPLGVTITSCVGVAVSYSLIFLLHLSLIGLPPLTWLLLPVVFAPLFVFALGTAYLMASVGTFIRDVRHAVPLAVQIGMLVTPILYPADRIPAKLAWCSLVNPLTPVFESVRALVLGNLDAVPWSRLEVVAALSLIYAILGYMAFRRKTSEFADVV